MAGDFNAKVGIAIENNMDQTTKSGKILMEMIAKQKLTMLNASNKCTGLWTRVSGAQKSVID